MKSILVLSAVLIASSSMAAEVPAVCYSEAEKAVARFVEKDYYDKDGIVAQSCELAPNKAAVLCSVSASKGEGEANDSFLVVLNKSCTKKFRVEMTGEE